ncbi:MAG: hypothetical protein A2977_01350 [Alphaproteobacteria bacterium RIFCSPLOWO2_01_FULL_45_8]|nr:MAG: hypothetical protein A2621_01810 [Alphaproteobacteria bacterium RIFCSPHIGHO2_01_FULL_41_14]OFW96709.1 MAG: hypothetical protein A2977_01350 [Alphaproteobacteria bacterium RIFCSPLOWO2_01_FULL_45_8]
MTTPPQRILVYVYEDLLGDGILKLPFVGALRKAFPKAHMIWCAGGGKSVYRSFLAPLIHSYLDEILEIPLGRTWGELVRSSPLKDQFFDLIIDTQRDLKTTLALKKVPHKTFISRTSGFFFSEAKPKKSQKYGTHLSYQLLRLLEITTGKKSVLEKTSLIALEDQKKKLRFYFPKGKIYIGFAPGAGNRKKCWPLDRFMEVAHCVRESGKIPVFILGPAEQEWYTELRSKVPGALFPLQENPSFLSNPLYTAAMGFFLEKVIVNDSGVAHLLSLSDTQMISLFGPTKAEKLHPLTKNLCLVKASDFGGKTMDHIPSHFIMSMLKKS